MKIKLDLMDILTVHHLVKVTFTGSYCRKASYENSIRKTENKFIIKEYKVFQIMKNWYFHKNFYFSVLLVLISISKKNKKKTFKKIYIYYKKKFSKFRKVITVKK